VIVFSTVLASGTTLEIFYIFLVVLILLLSVFRGWFVGPRKESWIARALSALQWQYVLQLEQSDFKISDGLLESGNIGPGFDDVVVAWRKATHNLGYQHLLMDWMA
jgi:hypothetical protein